MAARISKKDFSEKVLNSGLPVLVDFYSDSCTACKMLSPVLGDAEDAYEQRLAVYKINTTFDAEIAEEYGVTANPTLVLFKDGQEAGRKVGFVPGNVLNPWIESLLG